MSKEEKDYGSPRRPEGAMSPKLPLTTPRTGISDLFSFMRLGAPTPPPPPASAHSPTPTIPSARTDTTSSIPETPTETAELPVASNPELYQKKRNESLLKLCKEGSKLSVIQVRIREGADVNFTKDGKTPLLNAIEALESALSDEKYTCSQIIILLIRNGANTESLDLSKLSDLALRAVAQGEEIVQNNRIARGAGLEAGETPGLVGRR